MQIYELLDRFELLYEDINPDISNLRRVVIDKDLPSLFRILENFEDKELTENIRSAVCDLNPWAFYKIYENEDAEDFKKFILNKNIWSLFKILQKLYPDKQEILNDIKCIATTNYTPNDIVHSIFRAITNDNINDIKNITCTDFEPKDMLPSVFNSLLENNFNYIKNITCTDFEPKDMLHVLFRILTTDNIGDAKNITCADFEPKDMLFPLFRVIEFSIELHNDIRLIAVSDDPLNEGTVQALFRILQNAIDESIIDELRRAVTGETFSTKMRPLFSTFKDDKFLRNYYTATNREHASGQAKLNATFNVIEALTENNAVVMDLRAIVAHDNRPAMYNCLDYVLDSDLVRILERFEKEKPEYNLHDAFTQGQLRSKLWLLKHLRDIDLGTVFICAGWYGTLARAMFENERIHFDKIRSFDIDPKCAEVADMINKQWNIDDFKFKASTIDIHNFEWKGFHTPAPSDGTIGNFYYDTIADNKVVQMKDSPDTFINTSCEHIENFTDWFKLLLPGKLVALQTNNYFEIEDHINCVNSLDEFKQQVPLSNIIYEGELELEKYTRYMVIGYK
jgi:flagellar biosynthesis regulator FlbT